MHEPNRSQICEQIVNLLAANDPLGQELLLSQFSRRMRYLAAKFCPGHTNDCVHDAFVIVVGNLRKKQLHIPAALPGYIATILRRLAINKREEFHRFLSGESADTALAGLRDHRRTPEEGAEFHERQMVMRRTLDQMSPREREILTKFYLKEESAEQICTEMGLTQTQFRLLKSRSKIKLQNRCRRSLTSPCDGDQFALSLLACAEMS